MSSEVVLPSAAATAARGCRRGPVFLGDSVSFGLAVTLDEFDCSVSDRTPLTAESEASR